MIWASTQLSRELLIEIIVPLMAIFADSFILRPHLNESLLSGVELLYFFFYLITSVCQDESVVT